MSTIVNPAWKSMKEGTIVKWKGLDYEIGSDAFGSVTDAAAAGNTDDLVIVDKKLTSPVSVKGTKEAIGSAATDIFASTVTESTSADGKTETKSIKFSAAAGGTATINKDGNDPSLIGFEKVTTTKTGGSFQGGKQDISSSVKTVTDMDKGLETHDNTVSVSSSATGSLSVTGEKTSTVSATVAAIKDAEANTDESIVIAKDIYSTIAETIGNSDGGADAEEYKDKTGASYASLTLKFAQADSSINGGSYTEKATAKTSDTDGEKVTKDYSYSYAQKVGTGSASLTDASAADLIGFKSVKITSSNAAQEVAGIDARNYSADYTLKTAYDADKSSSVSISAKADETMAGGSLTVTGKAGKEITIGKEVEGFSSINLKYATVNEELDGDAGNEKMTIDISVKTQNDNAALTASYSYDKTETAQATFTASNNSTISGELDGFKSVTISNSMITGNPKADATNTTLKVTKKETGVAVEGISADQSADYVSKFGVDYGTTDTYDTLDIGLVEQDQAWTLNYSAKETNAAGGTSFKVSGKMSESSDSSVRVKGYKTVSLDNTSAANKLTASLSNNSYTVDSSVQEAFTPDVSYTETSKSTASDKAFGDATIKGKTEVTGVDGFASVKVTGTLGKTFLSSVTGQSTVSETESETLTIKAGKDNPIGTYTGSDTYSSKAASTVDVTKAEISGSFTNLKKVTLKDVKIAAGTTFDNGEILTDDYRDTDSKSSLSVTWNAEEISAAEAALVPAKFYDERVTSWTRTKDKKASVVGEFSLKNSDAANASYSIGAGLKIDSFKKVDITLSGTGVDSLTVSVASLKNDGDETRKVSEKRTITETKRTTDIKNESKDTAAGTLNVTGKSSSTNVTTLNVTSGKIEYATIKLKDAAITGANAEAYVVKESLTASESATLDAGTATVVTLKVSKIDEKAGNGSFEASGSYAFTAFGGTLNGYSTITLKDKISIGNVNNQKIVGNSAELYYVPTDEYFDVIAENEIYYDPNFLTIPSAGTGLNGNVSGSYSLDAKGQINSSWTGYYATLSSGSFKQSATVANVMAGSITGYDKVELTGVKSVGAIDGNNTENTRVLTYKYANDEEVANSDVTTVTKTSSSSVKLSGKKYNNVLQKVAATSISGYKTVTLADAVVSGTIIAKDEEIITITDQLSEAGVVTETVSNAIGSLTVSGESELKGNVSGFQKVDLKNAVAGAAIAFTGGSSDNISSTVLGTTFVEKVAFGTFSAVADKKQVVPGDPKLAVAQTVGDVTGFQKVTLDDYSAGNVAVVFSGNTKTPTATYVQYIPANDEKETPQTWNKAAATKNNQFTASADYYTDSVNKIQMNEITVGAVTGYGKVEATALKQIGSIENASIDDKVAFAGRNYGATHYGDWAATAKDTAEDAYTKISVAASGNAKIKGVYSKKIDGTPDDLKATAVTGNIAGYKDVTLDAVTLGSGAAVKYAGGIYSYTTKTNSDDQTIATSTNTANGTLKISNATFVAGTTFAVEGFKTVNVNIAGTAQFTKIIGGTESAQFTDGTYEFNTYKCFEKASVTTQEGSVTGTVAGFITMEFNDTNFAATTSEIKGYEISTKRVDGETTMVESTKSSVTFFDSADTAANTIAGDIIKAQSIVFKADVDTAEAAATKVDELVKDFTVSGKITSIPGLSGSTTIQVDKCYVAMDMSQFTLDDKDEINLSSGSDFSTKAVIELTNDTDLTKYFTNMAGSSITGEGIILATNAAAVATALADANINYDSTAILIQNKES